MFRTRLLALEVAHFLSDNPQLLATLPWSWGHATFVLTSSACVVAKTDAAAALSLLRTLLPSALVVEQLDVSEQSAITGPANRDSSLVHKVSAGKLVHERQNSMNVSQSNYTDGSYLVYFDADALAQWYNQSQSQAGAPPQVTANPASTFCTVERDACAGIANTGTHTGTHPDAHEGVFDHMFSPPDTYNGDQVQGTIHRKMTALNIDTSEPYWGEASMTMNSASTSDDTIYTVLSGSSHSANSSQSSLSSIGHAIQSQRKYCLGYLINELWSRKNSTGDASLELEQLLAFESTEETKARNTARMTIRDQKYLGVCLFNNREHCIGQGDDSCSTLVHLETIQSSHTDESLGDCSYLDTCFKGKACKFTHYRAQPPMRKIMFSAIRDSPNSSDDEDDVPHCFGGHSPQFLKCDLLKFDLPRLGNEWKALIVDPPWDIHTNGSTRPQTGTISDTDIEALKVGSLQTEGVIFLWVTGRAIDVGRRCLQTWGYDHIEELIWCKTNQLSRTICTGRTGHWLNHTKEHCLVGVKGSLEKLNCQMDVDVLVSNTLGKSQKPVELYGIIERMVGPRAPRLELFGRQNNVRLGWVTLGQELSGMQLDAPLARALRG